MATDITPTIRERREAILPTSAAPARSATAPPEDQPHNEARPPTASFAE